MESPKSHPLTTQRRIHPRWYAASVVIHLILLICAYMTWIKPKPPEEILIKVKPTPTQLMGSGEAGERMNVMLEKMAEIDARVKAAEAAEKAFREGLGMHVEGLIEEYALDLEIGGDTDGGYDYGLSFQTSLEILEMGKDAVEPLLNALDDLEGDFKARRRAAKDLARIGDERAIPTLVERFLADDGEAAWWGIMVAMNKMARDDPEKGKIIGDELLDAAKDPDQMAKMAQNWLFVDQSMFGGRGGWEKQLERFLLDGDKETKLRVGITMHDAGPINEKTQRTFAKVLLEDGDAEVRVMAATSLATGYGRSVIPELKQSFKKDESDDVRAASLETLTSLRAPDMVPINIQATQDEAARIRQAGASGLGVIEMSSAESRQAITALKAVVDDGTLEVRLRALAALGARKSREALPDVVKGLQSKNAKTVTVAFHALSNIAFGVALDEDTTNLVVEMAAKEDLRAIALAASYAPREQAIEALTDVVRNGKNYRARCVAILHLVAMNATETSDLMARYATHPLMGFRGRAIWALGRMNQRQFIPLLISSLHDEDNLGQLGGNDWTDESKKVPADVGPEGHGPRAALLDALANLHATEAIPDLLHLMENHPHPGFRLQVAKVLKEWAPLDKRIVPALARMAEDVHPESQLNFIDWLGDIGDKRAIKFLRKVYDGKYLTPDEAAPFAIQAMQKRTVNSAALEALVKLGDKKMIRKIKRQLKKVGDDEKLRRQLVDALRKLDPEKGEKIARETYTAQLDHEDDKVKAAAAKALARMRHHESIPKLIELAESLPADTERLRVLESLVSLGHREGVPKLLAEIIGNRDANEHACINASDLAGAIRAVECIPAMSSVILEDDARWTMRYRTAIALCRIGHPDAIPALIHPRLLKGPVAYGGGPVMAGLAQFNDPRVVDALIEFLEDKNDWIGMRSICATSLGKLGDPRAIPVLITQLKDPQMNGHAAVVRVNAATALAAIGTNEVIPALKEALDDSEAAVSSAALTGLIKMRVPDAIPVLIARLADEKLRVRVRASAHLQSLTGIDYGEFMAAASAYPDNAGKIEDVSAMIATADARRSDLDDLESRLEGQPDDLEGYLELAELLELLKMKTQARSIYRRYVKRAGDKADSSIVRLVDDSVKGAELKPGPWWFLGPFEYTTFNAKYPGEDELKQEAYTGKEGREVKWSAHDIIPRPNGIFMADFSSFTKANKKGSVSFLFRTLQSSKKQTLSLAIGSDDGLKVWFNGKLVIKQDVQRGMAPDQDTVDVEFKKGPNELLLRINNGIGPSGFMFRLLKKNGNPIIIDRQGVLMLE